MVVTTSPSADYLTAAITENKNLKLTVSSTYPTCALPERVKTHTFALNLSFQDEVKQPDTSLTALYNLTLIVTMPTIKTAQTIANQVFELD